MGLPAERASTPNKPKINDILIQGYLLSVAEGSAVERMTIGFGAGKSDLSVAVEGYQMTAQGPRKLGSERVESGGGRGPGGAVPLGVAIATGNPIGLIVTSGIKVYGEAARSTVEPTRPRSKSASSSRPDSSNKGGLTEERSSGA